MTVWQFTSSTPSPPIFEHDTQVSKSVEAITDTFVGVKMPAMSDSTPKKPVIIVKPSVSDLWRLCKCSFINKKKHLWWTSIVNCQTAAVNWVNPRSVLISVDDSCASSFHRPTNQNTPSPECREPKLLYETFAVPLFGHNWRPRNYRLADSPLA